MVRSLADRTFQLSPEPRAVLEGFAPGDAREEPVHVPVVHGHGPEVGRLLARVDDLEPLVRLGWVTLDEEVVGSSLGWQWTGAADLS